MKERFRERLPLVRLLFVPLVLYIGLLVIVKSFLDANTSSPWRYAAAWAPMVPGLFLAAGIVVTIRKLDKLNRKIILESLAIAFAATLFLTFNLGLLSLAGLAQPNSIIIALFMAVVVWMMAKLIITHKYL